MEKTTRELLADAIIELAGDEFETKDDIVCLVKESEYELIQRLISIAKYYQTFYNN